MDTQIVVVGSLNADYVINLSRFPLPGETVTGSNLTIYPGGKGANQAFAAARLGGCVSMVGQVGNDRTANDLKKNLESVGVDTAYLQRDASISSGMALISIDRQRQNQIIVVPGANGTFGVEQLASCRELISSARIVMLQLEIPMATVLAAARIAGEGGATVILDPAPAQYLPDDLFPLVDYLTPNETELAMLTDAPFTGSLDRSSAFRWLAHYNQEGRKK